MTLSLSAYPADGSSSQKRQGAGYTGPASYATGGDAVSAADVRMGTISYINGLTISNGTAVLHGWYNPTTGKILWFVAAGTQVTNTTDLSGYTGSFEFVGH